VWPEAAKTEAKLVMESAGGIEKLLEGGEKSFSEKP